jgi:hypothetical protein
MGQFKPMVKMMTSEPSVILKLKKGGKVASADAHKPMQATGNPFDAAEAGAAPKKPPMAKRQKAMNPNLYAKGGNVSGKQMGGMMPGRAMPAATMGRAPMRAMGPAALAGMAPDARMARAAQVRRALTGMKDGGPACAKLEKELEHHKSLSASKAHGKAEGGVAKFANTKMVDGDKHDSAKGTGDVKMGNAGGYKHGGMLKKAMGGSIMGNEGPFKNTKMSTAGKGKTSGTTGGVRMGNAGGYKKGGKIKKCADGGMVHPRQLDSETGKPYDPMYLMARKTPEGHIALRDPSIMDIMPDPRLKRGSPAGSGDIRSTYADGGAVLRPVNTSKPGKTNTTTGEVKLGNGGGYKEGGAAKKAYATGGNVVDDGKAQKMPRRPVHPPVANSLQSGTYRKGGEVAKNGGGKVSEIPNEAKIQAHIDSNERALKAFEQSQKEEAESTRNLIPNMARKAVGALRGVFSKPPAGSVTKTEKSVTVAPGASAPGRRNGGAC